MVRRPETKPPARALRLVEIRSDSDHAIGSYGNLLICVSAVPPSPEFLEAGVELVSEFSRGRPERVAVLIVVNASARPPNEATRSAVQDMYKKLRPMVGAYVYVIEGEGFSAAAKRGALTLVNMTTRDGFPLHVAGTVVGTLPWLRKTLGPGWIDTIQAMGLVEAVERLRSHLTTHARAKG